MKHFHVLVTGSTGVIGRSVCGALMARGHRVRGFDLRPTPWVEDEQVGDLTDREALGRAIAGVDAVVHLAATPNESDFLESLLPNNVTGLYNVCDLSRAHSVRRLVLTSSIQVTMGLEAWGKRPVRIEDGTAPKNHYALAKVWAESIGEMYAREHGMSVIVVRPGWVPHDDGARDQIDANPWEQCFYLSRNDAGRLFALTVEAENVKFAIIPAQSRGKQFNAMDLTAAREILGFEPVDTWPDGGEETTEVRGE